MNSYPSKAVQKEAIDRLSREYDAMSRSFPYSADIPYSLHNYRPAKHDKHLSAEVALKIKGLLVARAAIVATPIVKPLPAKQRREAEITLRFGENASLKSAMLAYAPALAAEFDAGWRAEIVKRVSRGDNKLEYIGNYRRHKSREKQISTSISSPLCRRYR